MLLYSKKRFKDRSLIFFDPERLLIVYLFVDEPLKYFFKIITQKQKTPSDSYLKINI